MGDQDDRLSSDLALSLKGQQLNDINFFSAHPLMDIGPYSIEADLQQQQQFRGDELYIQWQQRQHRRGNV